jgi:hypothetical protein
MTRALPALLLLALTIVGCGSTPTPSPPPTPGPTIIPAPSIDVDTAGRHADPALEALLPETLGPAALTRESQRGTELSRQSDALLAMLDGLGKTLDDFTVASAYSSSGEIEAQVGAWRIAGADPIRLMPGFITAIQASSTTKLTIDHKTVGGHSVTQIGVSGELTQGPLYAYVKDDMILFVQTTDPTLAEEALSKLP